MPIGAAAMAFKGGVGMFVYKSVITLDKQGRIVIPAKVREAMQVREGDSIAIEYQDGIMQVYVIDTEK